MLPHYEVHDGSGRPVAGVSVSLRSREPGGGADDAVTGVRGEARFIDLAAGQYAYRVKAPGQPTGGSADSVRLANGERKRVAVRLGGTGLSIAGWVRNDSGEPLAEIVVSAIRHRFASATNDAISRDQSARSAWSDADGSFVIDGLVEGEYDVRTSATDRYPSLKLGTS